MSSKISFQTVIFGISLGITIIAAAILSGGQHITLVIPIGAFMMVSGPISILAFRGKSKNIDRECDKREMIITDNAMKTTFYIMAFILSAYWAYDFAISGSLLSFPFLIACLYWGTFIISYCINKNRY